MIELAHVVSQSGRQVALAVSAADPDNDPLTYRFDWGDGAPATVTNGEVASHFFPEGEFRTYTVTVTVDDARGGQDTTTFEFDFPAPAQQGTRIRSCSLIEKDGFAVAIAVAANDPDGDMLTYRINWGDDSPKRFKSGVARHEYPEGIYRDYRITITVDDAREGLDAANIDITFPEPPQSRPCLRSVYRNHA